ncbi:MAG: pyrimidine 5'-nucleotidase [Anaerolineales bacterium]
MLRQLLFDLDETLYGPQTGLWNAIGERILSFMMERLRVTRVEAEALRLRYRKQYGVALNGLMAEYGVDPDDYLAYVHDLPLDQYLQPDVALNGMLARLPLPKAIFTNSDQAHATRVLTRLGIVRHFQKIIDIRALALVNKPKPEAYQRALRLLNTQPHECVFIDDLPQNLTPAQQLGLITIHVGHGLSNGALPPGVDYRVESVLAVERILAGLMGQT